MKLTLATLALFLSATSLLGQNYSTFYGTYDVNANINVNKNVNVSGTVNQNINKTVTTIDYGALAAANAQQEANRLRAKIFADEREARIAEAIAVDPFAAFTYADKWTQVLNKRESKKQNRGFTGRTYWEFRIPHPLLFSSTAKFGVYRNSSESRVVTEIVLDGVMNFHELALLNGGEYNDSLFAPKNRAENRLKMYPVGKISPTFKEGNGWNRYTHKAEIGSLTVYGHNGYKITIIFEDDYNYVIQDQYFSRDYSTLLNYACFVVYSIPKTEGTFEDLEGRRHYLSRLCEEIIATAQCRYY